MHVHADDQHDFTSSPPRMGFPLWLGMPLALILFVGAATWWSLLLGRKQASESVRQDTIRNLTWTASRLESRFERAFRVNDNGAVHEEMAALGADHDFVYAAIIDENDHVIRSMRVDETGKHLEQTVPAMFRNAPMLNPDHLRLIRKRMGGQVDEAGDGATMLAAFPLILGRNTGELRPNRIGCLVLAADYSSVRDQAFRAVTSEARSIFALTSLLAVGLGLFFHLAVARRLKRLSRVAEHFGSGGTLDHSGVRGRDEVADLARSMEQMMFQKTAADRERAKSEEGLRHKEAELAHVSRLSTMGEMVAGIAHEINQPLYAIANFAAASESMLKTVSSENRDELLTLNRQIKDQAVRSGDIIRRLRQFIGKTKGGRSIFPIDDAAHEARELLSFAADLKKISIQIENPASLDLRVHADKIQIEQVLVNLLGNAFDAMQDTTSSDRVAIIRVAVIEDDVHLAVEDNGNGVSSEATGKLFDPFFTTKTSGMGMGLAISRTIVEGHGGRIWVTPNHHRGTVVHFTLPLYQRA